MVEQDIIYSKIWSQDGCYNSTLFQATEGYKVYEKVTKLTVFTLRLIVSTWHTFRDNFGDFENQTFYLFNKF